MTLALLITAVTGAWAQSSPNVVEFAVPADWASDDSNVTAADLPGFKASTLEKANAWTGAPKTGMAVLVYAFDGNKINLVFFSNGAPNVGGSEAEWTKKQVFGLKSNMKFYYTTEPGIDVEWNPATKTGTFQMPAYDVEIAPIYAPVAKWATEGDAVLAPTAIEGVFAESTNAIVTAGTVATGQGTAMYAVTSTNQATAPALDAFSADVPTAKDITAAGDVLVWYYIKGADTPDGQEATDKNTFNDSEICATPLTVTVLSNKFDITLNAANANTIEAGKATVTVGGTAATVTEGKLQGVKMGSEVKMTAKEGYKFRKAEAKKGAAGPKYTDVVTICEKNGDNKYLISSFFDGTNANITTITKEEAIALAEYLGGGDIRVVYEEYEFSGTRYVRMTNAAGKTSGVLLSTTNTCNVPLYYVPAGN